MACNDVGKMVKYGGDRAKNMISNLGGKTRTMELMTSDNPDVRYRSLLAVQQIMSQHWMK